VGCPAVCLGFLLSALSFFALLLDINIKIFLFEAQFDCFDKQLLLGKFDL
jgi:hypothetical protein